MKSFLWTSEILLAAALAALLLPAISLAETDVDPVVERARQIDRLHSLLVLHRGEPVTELVVAGPGLAQPANIKSVSKTVLSVLAGIAIDRGLIESPDAPLVELLGDRFPERATPGADRITFGDALAMQIGLESTSGRHYGRFVQSDDWVRHVLTRPMVDRPGGRMIYSTGATHLAAAALVEASGKDLASLAREWLGEPLNIHIPDWLTDPQGVHFGGNEMVISPRALARIGELYRQGGRLNGRQIVSREWIERSWDPNCHSPWTGDGYGFGWFITEIGGMNAYYGRGFGGQALFVVPQAELTLAITSNPNPPSPGGWQFRQLRELVALAIDHYTR
ncbi:MAG: serine hydrolase [Wenzhouxiangella sp.]|nr:serine hydrolase [Wenzhouxiangella sp.]MCH8478901.1 beta-lactamase family protein [Wenzhouxiangella sp.]